MDSLSVDVTTNTFLGILTVQTAGIHNLIDGADNINVPLSHYDNIDLGSFFGINIREVNILVMDNVTDTTIPDRLAPLTPVNIPIIGELQVYGFAVSLFFGNPFPMGSDGKVGPLREFVNTRGFVGLQFQDT